MIRIVKPRTPPTALRTQGPAASREHCHAHDRGDPIKIKHRIYRHASVKAALRKAQHDKCAFCESRITHISYGDVEHFRPKSSYYWLAYSWDNLFLSCQLCNQRFKRDLFPLEDPAGRATSHHQRGRVASERPLLLNPGKEDPSRFLTFDGETALTIGGNRRGKTTIEVFGLNRAELLERRGVRLADGLEMAELRRMLLNLPPAQRHPDMAARLDRLDARLAALQADDAEYAAMMRAALADVRTND